LLGPEDEELGVGVATFRGDIRDPHLVCAAIGQASALIHMAGPPSVAQSFNQPELYTSVHVEGARVVFEAARRANLTRAVLVSSAELYGQPDFQPAMENTKPSPRSPYAEAKLRAEILTRALFADKLTIIRPFSVYGPGMRPGSVLGQILDQVAAKGPVELQSLEPVRDYVHVEDLASLICLGLRSRSAGTSILNGCSGQGVSVGELARLVVQIAGQAGPVRASGKIVPRPADIVRLVGDPSAALAAGWRGTRPLRQGLTELVANDRGKSS
jgi:nucleoside-diphosphate-sugar epimerase